MGWIMTEIVIRSATAADADEIVRLIKQLAKADGERSDVSAAYVREYLAFPGCDILMAVCEERTLGLLSYNIRPNLYHAQKGCLIEEFVVDENARGQGAGGALMMEIMRIAKSASCAEISVSTMPDNANAIRFYRTHGFEDEAVYLERHF